MNNVTTRDSNPLFGLDSSRPWDTESAFKHLKAIGAADTKRTAERRLRALDFLPKDLAKDDLRDEQSRPFNPVVLAWAIEQARKRRDRILFAQLHDLPNGQPCLHANDARGARFWVPLSSMGVSAVQDAAESLQAHIGKPIAIFPHGALVNLLRAIPPTETVRHYPEAYPAALPQNLHGANSNRGRVPCSPSLLRLEAESIFILRETVSEVQNPAILYSMDIESSVMLHLAHKAFYPNPPPIPLLHVDSRWEFQENYLFRDFVARESGMDLLVHTNPEAVEKDINPFDHGASVHTAISKTEGIRQALEKYNFDAVFTGARREKGVSQSVEAVISLSDTKDAHALTQKPDFWSLYNTRKNHGQRLRVLPLRNWTELDMWLYVYHEGIRVSPLYFAKRRPVVVSHDMIKAIDDERYRLLPGEEIQIKKVRFPALGCYPLASAIESEAESIEEVLLEMFNISTAERQDCKFTHKKAGSKKKTQAKGNFR